MIAPSSGATASVASHRLADETSPRWLSTNVTVFMPSAKSWPMTAMAMAMPSLGDTTNAAPRASPSWRLWNDSAPALSAPTCGWPAAISGSSRWWSTIRRDSTKNHRNPAPTRMPSSDVESSRSAASGRTSSRATPRTTPPVNAMMSRAWCRSRSARKPPTRVETTVISATSGPVGFILPSGGRRRSALAASRRGRRRETRACGRAGGPASRGRTPGSR